MRPPPIPTLILAPPPSFLRPGPPTLRLPSPTALKQQAGPLPTWALAPGPRARVLPRLGDWAPSGKPCRTWTCFSRMRRLLKVRFPSVQYLQGDSGRRGRQGTVPKTKAWGLAGGGGGSQSRGRPQPLVHSDESWLEGT